MCGRFTLTHTPEELARHFAARVLDNLAPSWNIAPTQKSVAITAQGREGYANDTDIGMPTDVIPPPTHTQGHANGEEGAGGAGGRPAAPRHAELQNTRRQARRVAWGLPARFRGGSILINARMETVAEKPTFRRAFAGSRCLVPASGWYEWSAPKTPWHIGAADGEVMGFAGLLLRHEGEDRFVILTGLSTGGLSDIHNRQPLVIAPADFDAWLTGDVDGACALCVSAGAERFAWHRVGPDVGKVSLDSPSLAAPI